jgi:FKBP-type peptidyl-prolyl cis-trans isomerase
MKSKIFFGLLILMTACIDDVPTSPDEQLQTEIANIAAYLEANPPGVGEVVVTDASGVTLVISDFGSGGALVPPDQNNELTIAYTGRLLSNGTIFDQTHATAADPFLFKMVNLSVINGWKIALSMMTEGMVAKVYIPSAFGYGKSGKGTIPGNATLVFDLNLISVDLTPQQETQFNTEKSVISGTLEGTPDLIEYPSGISMIHTQIGTGAAPGPYDRVEVKYKGRLLKDNTVFLEETTSGPSDRFSSRAINYLHGLNLAFQQMQAGGKATVYIPATLGYGTVTGPGVPPNSNLVYEVELTNVISE